MGEWIVEAELRDWRSAICDVHCGGGAMKLLGGATGGAALAGSERLACLKLLWSQKAGGLADHTGTTSPSVSASFF